MVMIDSLIMSSNMNMLDSIFVQADKPTSHTTNSNGLPVRYVISVLAQTYLPHNFFIELWHQGISLTNIDLWLIYNQFNSACTSEEHIHIFQGSHRLEFRGLS